MLSFRDVPSLCPAWLLWGPGLMPNIPLQSDSTTEMLLNALHEKSVLLKTVALQSGLLREPKDLFREPQVGTWEERKQQLKNKELGWNQVNRAVNYLSL